MRGDFDEDEIDDDGFDDECPSCDGEGVVMTCPDDMCRGSGGCNDSACYAPCRLCAYRAALRAAGKE